jgi:pyruvate formate-lyase activating enzyme-like uncharacterized protein
MSEIKNEQVKQLLLKAENFMKQENYVEAISYATASLEITLRRAKKSGEKTVQDLSYLDEITLCFYLGIDVEEYVRYRKMAGYRTVGGTGTTVFDSSGLFSPIKFKSQFNKKDAEVSLHYCTKTVKDIEETLERLNKPLSQE